MTRKNNRNTNKKPSYTAKNKTVNNVKNYKPKQIIKKHVTADNIIEEYPHFRRYRKSGHPALIVAEHTIDEYKYRKVMHDEKDGRHLNETIFPNPNPIDPEPMRITKRVRHDKKKFFEKRLPWKYPKK